MGDWPARLPFRLVRKTDKRFVGIICIGYGLALMDRSNLGAVKAPISEDLNLTEQDFALASSIFFVFYLILEIPSNAMVQRFGVRPVFSLLTIAFGMKKSGGYFSGGYLSRFLLARHTYDAPPWGVRTGSQTKSN